MIPGPVAGILVRLVTAGPGISVEKRARFYLHGAKLFNYENRLVKLQASGDSTANSTRGRVEEPEATSYKLDRYSIKDYIG